MTFVNERSVLAIGIVFIVLGIAAVAARFYVRRQGKNGLGIDDWLSLPALALVIGCCVIIIIGAATHTFGNHSTPLLGPEEAFYDGSNQVTLEKLEIPFNLIQIFALAAIKLSILFFYRRLLRGQVFDIASWVLIGLVIAWTVAFFVAILAACGTSIWANFQSLAALKEKCVNTFAIYLTLAVSDVAVDLAILIIPIPLILGLHMPLRRKLAVLGILLLGSLAVACGLIRMVFFAQTLAPALLSQATVGGLPSDDDLGIVSLLEFWAMLEMGVAMVASCLPTLRPLFQGWSFESIIRSFRSSISLRSMVSSNRSNKNAKEQKEGSESETAIAGIPQSDHFGMDRSGSTGDVEAYAMEIVAEEEAQKRKTRPEGIWRETEVKQTSEVV